MNRKPARHPSHRRVTNVPGHVRDSGKLVRGYTKVSTTLPSAYDPTWAAGVKPLGSMGDASGYSMANPMDPSAGMD